MNYWLVDFWGLIMNSWLVPIKKVASPTVGSFVRGRDPPPFFRLVGGLHRQVEVREFWPVTWAAKKGGGWEGFFGRNSPNAQSYC